jgi:hypothetical protein
MKRLGLGYFGAGHVRKRKIKGPISFPEYAWLGDLTREQAYSGNEIVKGLAISFPEHRLKASGFSNNRHNKAKMPNYCVLKQNYLQL